MLSTLGIPDFVSMVGPNTLVKESHAPIGHRGDSNPYTPEDDVSPNNLKLVQQMKGVNHLDFYKKVPIS